MVSQGEDKPILILGGTGHYGRHIVRSLLEKGKPVRVLSRNAANASKILGDGPKIIEGDITSRKSVAESLNGARAVVISVSAFAWKMIRQLERVERDAVLLVLEEAQKAGVSRVVYISVYDIKEDLLRQLNIQLESAWIKLEIEVVLAKSDFNWTVLGVSPSMEIFFSMIRGNTMMVPGGGPPALPTVSPVDVGEIATQTVLRDDLGGKRFRMTGPEVLSFPKAAKRISAVTGKAIRFRKIPLLPLKIVSVLVWPFNPYLRYLLGFVKLMNNFPQDVAAEVPKAHRLLVETFSYTPTTLEKEALRWSELS